MTVSGTWLGSVACSLLRLTVYLAVSVFILLAADPCQASGSSQMNVTLVGSDTSNMFFVMINTVVDLPLQLTKGKPPAGIVISNGMFSIDINADIDASASEAARATGARNHKT